MVKKTLAPALKNNVNYSVFIIISLLNIKYNIFKYTYTKLLTILKLKIGSGH